MSTLGEFLLRQLWRLNRWRLSAAPNPARHRVLQRENYIRWQYSSSPHLFSLYPGFDPKGKTVLEIGCGTGGRAAWLATTGATRVVGIDINSEEIEVAREMCGDLFPETRGRVEYYASSENEPLDLGQFDLVLLVDAMEHVVSPADIMQLAHHYTAPGGRFYFSTIGWFHHSGSHMPILPFSNLLFSDLTHINVMRWMMAQPTYEPTPFDSDPPEKRWEGVCDLRDRPGEYLNKITIRKIKELLRSSGFSSSHMEILGFHQAPWSVVNPLRHVPFLQEIFHSYIVVQCRK